jgi:hypothetical protein
MTRSRLKWTALTYAPAGLSGCVALFSALSGDWGLALLALAWLASGLGVAASTLSVYRAGYWRGRVDEYHDDPAVIVRRFTSGWEPSPWDDGRW